MSLGYLIIGLMVGGLIGGSSFWLFGLGAGGSLLLFVIAANLAALLCMLVGAGRR